MRTPAALREEFGAEVVQAVGTADLREAQDLRHAIIASIKADFRRGKGRLRDKVEDEQKSLIQLFE